MGMHPCSICTYASRNFIKLYNHYTIEHSSDPNFSIRCGVEGCLNSFSNTTSWKSHVIRRHRSLFLTIQDQDINNGEAGSQDENRENETDDCDMEIDCDASEPQIQSMEHELNEELPEQDSVIDFNIHLIKFLLKLREKNNISEKTAALIIQEYSGILELCLSQIEENMEKNRNPLKPLYSLIHAHKNNDTVQKQHTNIERNGYVDPKEIELGEGDRYIYIPLMQTLKSLLNHEDVVSEILADSPKTSDIDCYSASTSCKKNPLFSVDKHALQLKIYLDDFQIVNPLGTYTAGHKICGIYFSICNIPYNLQSKLYTIQLLMLCKSDIIKKAVS